MFDLNWFHIFSLAMVTGLYQFNVSFTHWGRMTHICVSRPKVFDLDNGLSPGRRQAIIWTNVGTLLIRPLGTKFNEILIEIHTFSFTKIQNKLMSSGNFAAILYRPQSVNRMSLSNHKRLFQTLHTQPLGKRIKGSRAESAENINVEQVPRQTPRSCMQ